MSKVRPTRIVTPRIVQPGSTARVWFLVLFAVVLAVWTWQVFDFGRQQGERVVQTQARVEQRLHVRIADLEQERDTLRAAAARFERAAQIDRAAAEQVRAEVGALQEERAGLQRELAFLKSLLPGSEGEELVLASPNLTALGERAFRFEVTLTKPSANDVTVSGEAMVKVRGNADGEPRTLGMASLTAGKRTNIGIRFKNFQTLKAELRLPEGFEPQAIEVAVKPDGEAYRPFRRAYDWKPADV
jgi:hypothetical protein